MGVADEDSKETDPEDSSAPCSSAIKVLTLETSVIDLFDIDINAGLFSSAVAWTKIVFAFSPSGALE